MEQEIKRTLFVFDFDDTIVDTASSELRVKITHVTKSGKVKTHILTSDEYASFKIPTTGKIQLNFADFETVPSDIIVKEKYFNLLTKSLEKNSKDSYTIILTARAARNPVIDFLKNVLSSRQPTVVALGTSDPYAKSSYIKKMITRFGFNEVYYYDDAKKNIDAVDELSNEYQDIEFKTYHVVD